MFRLRRDRARWRRGHLQRLAEQQRATRAPCDRGPRSDDLARAATLCVFSEVPSRAPALTFGDSPAASPGTAGFRRLLRAPPRDPRRRVRPRRRYPSTYRRRGSRPEHNRDAEIGGDAKVDADRRDFTELLLAPGVAPLLLGGDQEEPPRGPLTLDTGPSVGSSCLSTVDVGSGRAYPQRAARRAADCSRATRGADPPSAVPRRR